MARKNCERINAVKTVNGYYVFLTLERRRTTGFFLTVRKLYIDAYLVDSLKEVSLIFSMIATEGHPSLLSSYIYIIYICDRLCENQQFH